MGWIGAFTALLAAMLACVQRDIKRVLAYSTVSQLGYMMAAIGAGFAGAGFLHLLTHGVFKALLFLAAGAVIHAVGTNDIFAMGGLARRMPQTFIVFLIGTLSLAGIPFFAGFFSKEEILGAVWAGGLTVPFAMLVLAAFLTAFYMFRVVFIAFLGAPAAATASAGHGSAHGSQDRSHAHDAPAIMTLPLWILAAPGAGHRRRLRVLAPGGGVRGPGLAHPARGRRGGGRHRPRVARLRARRDQRRVALPPLRAWSARPRWSASGSTTSSRSSTAGGILAVARVVGWVDRYIVDGVLNVLSAWTLTAGRPAAPDPVRPGPGLRLRHRARRAPPHGLDAVAPVSA